MTRTVVVLEITLVFRKLVLLTPYDDDNDDEVKPHYTQADFNHSTEYTISKK